MNKLITTADGSHTLYHEALEEHYHSIHGALAESLHVFIKNGLEYIYRDKKQVEVLEIGLGTGLNALLTGIWAAKDGMSVRYDALEAYPLDPSEADQLNYPELLEWIHAAKMLQSIHIAAWEKECSISDHLLLRKMKVKLQEYGPKKVYDLIYFDAFGPVVQPEMWEQSIMDRMYEVLREGGVLVTYCAKGVVKRRLRTAGFEVESLPGPPGKREMTRAIKAGQ